MAAQATVALEATEERFLALKHFPSGLGFEADGTARWPADQFTFRLRDEGSIRLLEELHDAGAPVEPVKASKPAGAASPATAVKE
ncbi:hypothetical protein [Methylobacterium gnaphalii]|uniref:Uncharacterized protein n=1 Tax=Methylobacterium gnaphalii TaxID=1010610 RepID=A0A512JIW4_9HYPH|nr:hypothetical protein [Methylobacterium gnaphalii]GEP09812.1 hypothetical protein MGN01_16570 [Methylobacterium gnaphalii]GJD67273.1 hypothetical protein MMMDOFMJ_0187 [Methylobacterium gnaphalii]GLS49842.1 hypothetical protein GCM10007885_26940 [Methylobacterium gnaphalii]